MIDVQYHSSLTTNNLESKTSAITLTLGSKKDAQVAKTALKRCWIRDCLLKVRSAADAKEEDFSNRTVIIQNIPKNLNAEQVLDYYGKDTGAIVGLELPTENTKLKQIREEIENRGTAKDETRKKAAMKNA